MQPVFAPDVQKLRELAGLTAGLAQDAGIRLRLGDDWSFSPETRELTLAADTLREAGIDFCAGLICHEVGHFFISRYLQFRPWPAVATPLRAHLLNALEDPRVEHWMAQRYPGASVWLGAVHKREVLDLGSGRLADQPDFIGFCIACSYEPTHGWKTPPGLSTKVAESLAATRAARRAYQSLQPPTVSDSSPLEYRERNLFRERVWPDLADRSTSCLSHWEQRVLLSAWQAHVLTRDEILPTARVLWEADQAHLATCLRQAPTLSRQARDAIARNQVERIVHLLARIFAAHEQVDVDVGAETAVALRDLAAQLLLFLHRASARPITALRSGAGGTGQLPGSSVAITSHAAVPEVSPGYPPASPAALPPLDVYGSILQRVEPQIDRLYAHFEESVQPRRRLRGIGGFATGTRVDPRRIMAYAADRRRHDQLWMRRTLPERCELAVSVLVDLSGSMSGEKIAAALDGVVLLAEVLHRLDAMVAINGFQNVLIPLCDFHEGLTENVRARLLAMPLEVRGQRPGGNNVFQHNDDGPCTRAAAEALLANAASNRVLIVVSDGLPEGGSSDAADLRRVIAEILLDGRITLIGVGIGPGTEHVQNFYPQAIASVPVEAFADTLGNLVKRLLGFGPLES